MDAIVAVDARWGIGRDGGLLFRISADLRRFKALTMGHTVVMGRRTLQSLPGGVACRAAGIWCCPGRGTLPRRGRRCSTRCSRCWTPPGRMPLSSAERRCIACCCPLAGGCM